MHVGTFTPEGTWDAARARAARAARPRRHRPRGDAGGRLPRPLRLGLRRRRPLRPHRLYGPPDDFRALRGRGACPGPGRDPRRRLQPPRPRRELPHRSSPSATSPTATARNGASPSTTTARTAGPVREFFVANAVYWITEFHLDGLRLDATQSCTTPPPSTSWPPSAARRGAAARAALDHPRGRERAAAHAAGPARRAGRLRPRRPVERRLPPQRDGRPDRPQRGLLHATTAGAPQELLSALKYGYLYQGQRYRWQGKRRGTPGLRTCRRPPSSPSSRTTTRWPTPPAACARTPLTSPGRWRALTAVAAARPRHADAVPGPGVRRPRSRSSTSPTTARSWRSWCARGASEFLAQFRSLALAEWDGCLLPDPASAATFESCKLDHGERERHARGLGRCTATCSGCAATDPVLRAAGRRRRSTGRCSASTRSCCASSARTATTACWS